VLAAGVALLEVVVGDLQAGVEERAAAGIQRGDAAEMVARSPRREGQDLLGVAVKADHTDLVARVDGLGRCDGGRLASWILAPSMLPDLSITSTGQATGG
jgi:hypothetical protein